MSNVFSSSAREIGHKSFQSYHVSPFEKSTYITRSGSIVDRCSSDVWERRCELLAACSVLISLDDGFES
jgi:hypothetical protein